MAIGGVVSVVFEWQSRAPMWLHLETAIEWKM